MIQSSLKNSFIRCKHFINSSTIDDWFKHFNGTDSHGTNDNRLDCILWHLIEHDIHHRTQLQLQFKFLNKKINVQIYWKS